MTNQTKGKSTKSTASSWWEERNKILTSLKKAKAIRPRPKKSKAKKTAKPKKAIKVEKTKKAVKTKKVIKSKKTKAKKK